ncbi:MAG: hypothetical protein ACK4NC_01500 [Candidatus Gracilibacteria bacterium]
MAFRNAVVACMIAAGFITPTFASISYAKKAEVIKKKVTPSVKPKQNTLKKIAPASSKKNTGVKKIQPKKVIKQVPVVKKQVPVKPAVKKTPVVPIKKVAVTPMELNPITSSCVNGKLVLGVRTQNRGRPYELIVTYKLLGETQQVVDDLGQARLSAKTYFFTPGTLEIFAAQLVDKTDGHKYIQGLQDDALKELGRNCIKPVATPTPTVLATPTPVPTKDPELEDIKRKLKQQQQEQKALEEKVKELERQKSQSPVPSASPTAIPIPSQTPVVTLPWWEGVEVAKDFSVAPAADIRGTAQIPNAFGSNFSSTFFGIGGKAMFSDIVTLRLLGGGRYNYGSYGLVPAGIAEIEVTPLEGMLKFTGRGEFYPAFLGWSSEGFAGASIRPYAPVPLRIGVYGLKNPESWMVGVGPEFDYKVGLLNFNLKAVLVPSGLTSFGQFSGIIWGEIKY